MAYSTGAAPITPPPPMNAGAFSHAYDLHNDTVNKTAQQGIAPVNQMNSGFGGRQGGNPGISTMPSISGGNRTSQHVATPGNNNVSYGSENLISSAQSLWQQSRAQGAPAPVNGMSLGFIKNTQPRPGATPAPAAPVGPTAPVTPPPPTQPMVGGTGPLPTAINNGTAYVPPKGGIGTVATNTPAPVKVTMTEAAARANFLATNKGSSLTMKGPNGSTIYTPAWAAYRASVNIKG